MKPAVPKVKVAGGVVKEGGASGDLSPWCPGSRAAGWGWRKAAVNGVSVEPGKANTAAWATLACWGGGRGGGGHRMGQGPGLISASSFVSSLLAPEASWAFAPQCPAGEWV